MIFKLSRRLAIDTQATSKTSSLIPENTIVSVSPHVKSSESVSKIMWTVVACLLPSLILSCFVFGAQVLFITLVSVASCVGVEALCQIALKRKISIFDGSAVLTGLLIAFVIPPGVSFSLPILAAIVAIFLGKQIFGGLGYNIFNPALLARAFLLATFPVAMTSAWIMPHDLFGTLAANYDAITGATPLAVLKEQGYAAFQATFGQDPKLYTNFFLGLKPGCIGETSGLLILLGGLFLIYKKYITWHIPVSILATIALLTWIFGGSALFEGNGLLAILSGGAMLGAFFMATDYVTSPTHKPAKLIYGMGIGALTVLIRLKGGYPEGMCYAILLMNPLATVFDNLFKIKRFCPETKKLETKETPKTQEKTEETPKTQENSKENLNTKASEETPHKPETDHEEQAHKNSENTQDTLAPNKPEVANKQPTPKNENPENSDNPQNLAEKSE